MTTDTASGAIALEVGLNTVTIIVEDNGHQRTYTISVTRDSSGAPLPAAYIKASNTDALDVFGVAVALSGDTLVVGAPSEASDATGIDGAQDNNLEPYNGAVYVFINNAGTWEQQAYIKADFAKNQSFGDAVAIDGDTLVVGAPWDSSGATTIDGIRDDASQTGAGSAWVFVRSGSTWTQQAYLKASNAAMFDHFGRKVAISGDTIAVATYDDSNSVAIDGNETNDLCTECGSVFVFVRSDVTWSKQAYVKGYLSTSALHFGADLSLSGETLAVGAPGASSDAGRVYIYTRTGTAWAKEAEFASVNTGAGDLFGFSVSLDGDTLAVGATGEASSSIEIDTGGANNSALSSGAAYVFTRSGTTWSQEVYL
ncbi:integrin, partial [Myxococcota bacterium]|nr:integrin [Myxococcota bacterium]